MNSEELKYVVGEAHEDQPAIMRFYGRIDDCSTRQFNDEFCGFTITLNLLRLLFALTVKVEEFCME